MTILNFPFDSYKDLTKVIFLFPGEDYNIFIFSSFTGLIWRKTKANEQRFPRGRGMDLLVHDA